MKRIGTLGLAACVAAVSMTAISTATAGAPEGSWYIAPQANALWLDDGRAADDDAGVTRLVRPRDQPELGPAVQRVLFGASPRRRRHAVAPGLRLFGQSRVLSRRTRQPLPDRGPRRAANRSRSPGPTTTDLIATVRRRRAHRSRRSQRGRQPVPVARRDRRATRRLGQHARRRSGRLRRGPGIPVFVGRQCPRAVSSIPTAMA